MLDGWLADRVLAAAKKDALSYMASGANNGNHDEDKQDDERASDSIEI